MHRSHLNSLWLISVVISLISGYSANLPQKLPYISFDNSKAVINGYIEESSFNGDNWHPIDEILNYNKSVQNSFSSQNPTHYPIFYDRIKQIELLRSDNENLPPSTISSTEPFYGMIEDQFNGLSSSYVFSPDDRQKINTTDIFPWRSICRLYITAQDDTRFIGSGAIIDEFHVLTCGHCAYLHDNGGWAREIEVAPGKREGLEPFGRCNVISMRSTTGWTQDEMPEHDWAVLTLDRSIGLFTGWMGRKTADYSSSFYTDIVHSAGYPADLDLGNNMYYTSESGDRADEFNHWYWLDTAGGQSGSPVWMNEGGAKYIISIHAYGYEGGTDANFGTRLNANKFTQLNTWLAEESSTLPDDKPDLLDRGYYSNISATSIITGVSHFVIYCDVKNEGTAVASSFNINYYISKDQYITPSDYMIGRKTIINLNPFEFQSADLEGMVANAIPEGKYYIGWIIDGDDEIAEWDEDNNVVLLDNVILSIKEKPFDFTLVFLILLISSISVFLILLEIKRIIGQIPNLDIEKFS